MCILVVQNPYKVGLPANHRDAYYSMVATIQGKESKRRMGSVQGVNLAADTSPALLFIIGFKVFMDAHGTVTAEEWGSVPPKAAKICKFSSVVEQLLYTEKVIGSTPITCTNLVQHFCCTNLRSMYEVH